MNLMISELIVLFLWKLTEQDVRRSLIGGVRFFRYEFGEICVKLTMTKCQKPKLLATLLLA